MKSKSHVVEGNQLQLAACISWHTANNSPRLCNNSVPVKANEELHLLGQENWLVGAEILS